MNEIKLTPNTRFVILRFAFSNPDAIPVEMRGFQRKPNKSQPARKPGNLVIDEKGEFVSVRDALNELADEGYILIDGFFEERPNDLGVGSTQYIVGFTLLHREFVKEEPGGSTDALLTVSFDQIAEEALWRGCRGYENPCYDGDKEVDGATAVVLNFAARQPLCDRDGKPITQRQRDAEGKKIQGKKAEPVRASHLLRVENKVIRLVPAE